jgi:signal peptidase II
VKNIIPSYRDALIFFVVMLADRYSKAWALQTLSEHPWHVVPGFNYVLAWNRGISWSLFSTSSFIGYVFLTAFVASFIGVLWVYTNWRIQGRKNVAFEMMMLGGALSNLIDRLWYGAVIDFIQLYVGPYYWPVFNVADMCIMLGVLGILIRTHWYEHAR